MIDWIAARINTEDIDIESEDPESEEDVDSTRSNSVANLPNRALTARQAALANVAETSHVSLGKSAIIPKG